MLAALTIWGSRIELYVSATVNAKAKRSKTMV
jgi:hypothetical protein